MAQVKPTITRKLRRRPNDPLPVVESKRRKPTNGQLILLLEEKDIDNDLKLISRGKALITPIRKCGILFKINKKFNLIFFLVRSSNCSIKHWINIK